MSESQTPTPRTDAVMRLHAECKSKMATPANEHVLRRHVEELERDLTTARAEVERLREALQELVRLKHLHDRINDADAGIGGIHARELAAMRADYRTNKPIAWTAARAALAAKEMRHG